ncbi:MAG TPA: ABC transporter ATP-binding protein [Candidatus Acidoferrales bacterium]|nr:ABC transporter ATP-binding protein [Candidatus Acidoferrales bacterium]
MNGGDAGVFLEVRGLTKRFASVRALDAVDLDFCRGEIHAVLGENGAGKSTLMHVLAGIVRPDRGSIVIDGKAIPGGSPRASRAAGIGMVHQHFALVDALTVAENLALSLTPANVWRFDSKSVEQAARQLAERVGLDIAPSSAIVGELPVGARQRLEILKALAGGGRVLILDEPTAVLTPSEARQLFAMLRQLRDQGQLILFITHKLREVKEVADRVSIMRHGRVVGTFAASGVPERELAEQMVGEIQASSSPRKGPTPDATPALRVDKLNVRDGRGVVALADVSFVVRRGEILGIAGVDGNGQHELFGVLAGLTTPESGRIEVAGRALSGSTAALRSAGVGYVPPDRHREGLVLAMSVVENLLLHRGALRRLASHGFLRQPAVRQQAKTLAQRFKIKAASVDSPASSLSGGNQQRIVVARELSQPLTALIVSNPTRGLDLLATRAVADALRDAAANGCGVVLISTDLDEVLDLSDSVRVLYRGRLSATLTPPLNAEHLGLLMAGAATMKSAQADSDRSSRITSDESVG